MNARVTTPAERGQDAECSYWWSPVMDDHVLGIAANQTHTITEQELLPAAR